MIARLAALSVCPARGNFSRFCRYVLIKKSVAAGGGVLDFQLSDEQQQLKKTVREFAEREILPNVMKWDEACEFPLATVKELGKLGLLGTVFPTEYARRGHGLCGIRDRHRRTVARGWLGGHHCRGAYFALFQSHFSCRQRGAEKEVRQQTGYRRIHRRVGIDRALFRIGRGQRAHDREAPRKQLGAERHENFLH